MTNISGDGPLREEELAALADGTLDPARRDAVERAVAASPELAARLAEQERALVALTRALGETSAPLALRARIAQAQAAAPRRRRSLRLPVLGGVALAAAAALVAVVALLPGSSAGPSLASAAELTARPATAGPPAAATPKLLALDVEGLPFPDWRAKFGWQAVGTRTDRVGGRAVTTVTYAKAGKRIGYGIVAGKGLKVPSGGTSATAEGTAIRLLTLGGRRVATWQRQGHTCILTATGVPDATLVKLAAWHGVGAVPF